IDAGNFQFEAGKTRVAGGTCAPAASAAKAEKSLAAAGPELHPNGIQWHIERVVLEGEHAELPASAPSSIPAQAAFFLPLRFGELTRFAFLFALVMLKHAD